MTHDINWCIGILDDDEVVSRNKRVKKGELYFCSPSAL